MRALLATALLLTALLAGCSSGDKDGDGPQPSHDDLAATATPVLHLNITADDETHRFTSAPAAGHAGHGNATSTSASGTTTVSGNASASGNATGNTTGGPAGLAPLDVTFELGASKLPAGSAVRWSFDFGRTAGNATGNATAAENGTTLPATLEHAYTSAGDYNVTFILRVGNLTPQALQATIHIENGTGNVTVGKPAPDQVHFEYGESLGCTGDLPVGITCLDWEAGPPGSDVDGHWIPLDDRYWGFGVTTTVDQGNPATHDTDCVFTDADKAVLGEGNNGSGPCLGSVPDGSAWMFVYSYGTPALAMTVDFAPSA
ncbi:MAG TPA: hypothetical protein VJ874_05395 [Candidatus Thermoplasmatota archaeon]|nr:hypothetical protein [Candidatus Thermoplasmatota archaeon]